MRSKLSIAALLLLSTPVSAGPIDNIPVGHWYQVPNSHLRDAEKPPSAYADWDGSRSLTYERIGAVEGVSAVINDWSGGIVRESGTGLWVGPIRGRLPERYRQPNLSGVGFAF